MASVINSPGVVGSENFQASDNQDANLDAQPKTSVSNGPSSPDAIESANKDNKKAEEIVKKFDNVNYVEAPIPKTNPWNKGKTVTEPGMKRALWNTFLCFHLSFYIKHKCMFLAPWSPNVLLN